TIHERTNYPFSDVVEFDIKVPAALTFPLHLRIPAWCREAVISINGQELRREHGSTVAVINRKWTNNDKVTLRLPMEVTTSEWGRNSRAIERGPLVYALKVGERWEKATEATEGDYYSIFPTSDWNYGILESVVKSPDKLKVTE